MIEKENYIESGILELYVYGLLEESENREIRKMADEHPEIEQEISAIETAVINLSTSFCPFLSADTFERIKGNLDLKAHGIIEPKSRPRLFGSIGWAASLLFLLGMGYFYTQWDKSRHQIVAIEKNEAKLKDSISTLETKTRQTEFALTVVRDAENTVIPLDGQDAAPNAYAKVYWNQETKTVYIDAAGLPEPPEGMVYQVWALQLKPMKPTSIGMLENFITANSKLFSVNPTDAAEAFAITLEPAEGSASPTLEQLYVLGKV